MVSTCAYGHASHPLGPQRSAWPSEHTELDRLAPALPTHGIARAQRPVPPVRELACISGRAGMHAFLMHACDHAACGASQL